MTQWEYLKYCIYRDDKAAVLQWLCDFDDYIRKHLEDMNNRDYLESEFNVHKMIENIVFKED